MKTWTDLNQGHQHKLLTDDLISGYVREQFHAKNPDIEETFLQVKDFVLQLDLIKYMVLWAEGGVYSDLDVACVHPVREWIPQRFIGQAGIVLGVQVKQKAGDGWNDEEKFQLADWTIMSKPNQPFLWFLYQRFTENIKKLVADQVVSGQDSRPYNVSDVTGRKALTQAFLAYATSVTATKITADNFTEVGEPTLFGEILVLPVQSFASSHRNRRELVHHYEAGSWKSEPWDKLQLAADEEQGKKKPEDTKVAEEEKNGEAEKQKLDDVETTAGDQDLEDDKKVGVSEEKENSPAGNNTSSTTKDKPPSVQYENAQAKNKPTTNDKPPSIQYENLKFTGNVTESNHNTNSSASQQSTNDKTDTENATDEDTETKTEEETKAKEEAEILKAEAAAKEAAEAKELAEAQKNEEQEREKKNKITEAQKRKEEEEKRLAEEEAAQKKAAEPKWAPLNEAGTLVSSNNLADYGAEYVPLEDE